MIKRYFETRRQYPRLKTNIAAIASSQTGVDFPVIIHDLSPEGAQITYQGNKEKLLYEKTADFDVLKKLRVNLKFNLPYADQETVEINTRPIHHHHLGNQMYIVGVIFDEYDIEQKNKIMEYLTYEAEPNFEELKKSYGINKLNTSSHNSVEKVTIDTVNHKTKLSDDNNNTGKRESIYNFKHELAKLNTALNSLIGSVKTIEEKLDRLERKISK